MTQKDIKYPHNRSAPFKTSERRGATKIDRRKLARELRDSEGRFRAVVEQSIAAIYVIQERKIVYVNPRMRELFGYGPEEAFDPDPLAHVKESDWPKVIDQMQRRLQGEGEAAYSITALRKDRKEFLFGIHATRAVFQEKRAIIGVAQDITDKVRVEEDTRCHVERLQRALESTVEAITTIGGLRDPYTNMHERRVGEIAAATAAAIASEMGLDAERARGIRIAGFLHDVGKISVPAEILSKPARLTPTEYELVKAHARHGHEILRGIEFPWPVAQVALQHHERLDGSGYPNGIKGDAIVLEARIVAIADVVEAMASHRPYRAGLGIDKALAEIERGRTTLFDSDASDACLRLFRERGYTIPT